MNRIGIRAIVCLLLAGMAVPALAWGPKANVAIVTTAARIISKDTGVPLANLEKDIRDGAGASMEEIEAFMPVAETNPVGAVQSEMYLLQAVRGSRVDPYFAYRLGVLGALVAQITTPLYGSNPTYRNLYYADVEANINRVPLQSARRVKVDPATYFDEVVQEARNREDLIISDYKSGVGFSGVAGTALSEDASRSVNAVADVMKSILEGGVTVTNISQSQIRDYALKSIQFYIARGNDAETEAAYQKLMSMGVATVDLQKQIGDMFYDAGKFDRAMKEYKAVLAKAPSRRDVIERIADYYVRVGDAALADNRLENALEAYTNALNVDMLHPQAQSKKLEAEGMIAKRDSRLDAARQALTQGDDLLRQADQLVFKREYDQALDLLRDAQKQYGSVTDEFPSEAREAKRGLLNVSDRMGQLQKDVVSNASALSGLGTSSAIRSEAETAAKALDQEALKHLIDAQYQAELDKLRNENVGK